MKYRENKKGEKISVLGYGCMRFTKNGRGIDIDKAEAEILHAVSLGVNYFDTAYVYSGSEEALGEIFSRNDLRKEVNIATKLPHYMAGSIEKVEEYFNEELRRLRTDYIDYYLLHHLTDISQRERMKNMGMTEWIAEKKEKGIIRNIGFSYHGNSDNFIRIINDYPWDMCMIQYNYADEVSQAGVKGLKEAAGLGIPVVIMEPLRGGKLVNMLPEKAKERIAGSGLAKSPSDLAFKWLWNQPEVTCVLSGMNSIDMIDENVETACEAEAGCFTDEHFKLIKEINGLINESFKVGCTECGYCMPCPKGVDIPGIFRCYNRMFTEGKFSGRKEYFQTVALGGPPAFASQCINCGKCESHCPQSIEIRKMIRVADKALRPLPYRLTIAAARKYLIK